MQRNDLKSFIIDVKLMKNKKFIPSVLLELIHNSSWDKNSSWVEDLNKSAIAKKFKISRPTIDSQLKFLESVGKIKTVGRKVYITSPIGQANVNVKLYQKEMILKLKNKTVQRVALYHINTCNIFGGRHSKALSVIKTELDIGSNTGVIAGFNKEIEKVGLMTHREGPKTSDKQHYGNNIYTLCREVVKQEKKVDTVQKKEKQEMQKKEKQEIQKKEKSAVVPTVTAYEDFDF